MALNLSLTSADGHQLSAYEVKPAGPCQGGIVVLQEIFGVNHHIRAICDRLAVAGYRAVAPALFDRQQRDFESGYTQEEIEAALKFMNRLDWDATLADVRAAIDHLRPSGPVAVLGFCLGGSLAYLAGVRVPGIAAVVGYYGGQVVKFSDEAPACPTLLHYGATDHTISLAEVETIRKKRPDCDIHVYAAGHGFNCDERAAYNADAAGLAWQRSMTWVERAFSRSTA